MRNEEIMMKGEEYIQAKVICLSILSLNKNVLEGLNAAKEIKNKKNKTIVKFWGGLIVICSLEARVAT